MHLAGNRQIHNTAPAIALTTASDDEVLGHCGGLGAKPSIPKVCPEPKPCKRMQALANPSCKPLLQAPATVSSTKIERGMKALLQRKRTEASDGVPQAGLRRLGFPASASVKWAGTSGRRGFCQRGS